jgi:RNA polymerase sigma factor (sigma-70 family)
VPSSTGYTFTISRIFSQLADGSGSFAPCRVEPVDAGHPGNLTMTVDAVRRVASHLVRPDDSTDAELLGRFVAERDGAAFAALVERHGSMVFGVCLRLLGDWHLAEDAFQATFVVLARRGTAIRPGAVAGWLHGVAHRVARNARRTALRRAQRERQVDAFPDPPAPTVPDRELRAVIDDELRKLPAKYRELLVACDLEGRPRRSVAEGLGIPEGTLSSRLAAARKMLVSRLARRGIAPGVLAAVATGGPAGGACEVPPLLVASTVRVGCGEAGTVPAPVATLASGAIRAMTVRTYLPWIAGLLLVALLTAVSVAAALTRAPSAPPDPPRLVLEPQPEPKPAPVGPNKLFFVGGDCFLWSDPDGKNQTKVKSKSDLNRPAQVRLSPDGKTLAQLITVEVPDDLAPGEFPPGTLHVRGLEEKEPGTNLGIECESFAWSADGTEIVYSGLGKPKNGEQERPVVHGIVNVKTKARTALKFPTEHIILDWSHDGKYFLTRRGNDEDWSTTLFRVSRDGTEHKALHDPKEQGTDGRLSPEGKRVLYTSRPNLVQISPTDSALWVLDLGTGKRNKVSNIAAEGMLTGFCWSPDGKRIAYTWGQSVEDMNNESRLVAWLVVCDPDGKNAAKVELVKGLEYTFTSLIDWR